jgi:hypothetical protein
MENIPFKASSNGVSKIVVVAYKDKEVREKADDLQPFVIPVNPENYSQNFKVEYDVRRGHGQQKTEVKFKSTAPEELKLDFVFDGTKTIQEYYHKEMPVKKQVEQFLNTVYDMSGEIHMPRYLKLFWGENFMLQCVLTNLDINYTLFSTNGEPLRAKISATFLDHIAKEQRVARENKRSPDLSHVREVKGDDRLDLLTYKIYNNSKFLLQVAKANNLPRLRNIPAGTSLLFPPFDKNER